MKSMKGLSMNKMLGGIKRRSTNTPPADPQRSFNLPVPREGESPETTAQNSVQAFCESGTNIKGDEVLFLPPIVEAAESSPAAAAGCARMIRKYLGKDYFARPAWQYNAIMLLRILTENPGPMFTRNFDQKFADVCKGLLRGTKDLNVKQMLMETLDDFEGTKSYDENLSILLQMWTKEKGKVMKAYGNPMHQPRPYIGPNFPPPQQQHPQQNYFLRHHNNTSLPDPVELTSRLEEARTSAKLLEQVVMNTPPAETLDNELIKEFADRCLSASRSIQAYMVSRNPAPDNETMESLIDTNEQLQTALNQHQRSVLNARKQLGLGERSNATSPAADGSFYGPDLLSGGAEPNAPAVGNGKGKVTGPLNAQPSGSASASGSGTATPSRKGKGTHTEEENPFADPFADPQTEDDKPNGVASSSRAQAVNNDRMPHEPFHPGFTSASGSGSGTLSPSTNQNLAPAISEDDLYDTSPSRSKDPSGRN